MPTELRTAGRHREIPLSEQREPGHCKIFIQKTGHQKGKYNIQAEKTKESVDR